MSSEVEASCGDCKLLHVPNPKRGIDSSVVGLHRQSEPHGYLR